MNKLTSRRFLAALWAMLMTTFIIGVAVFLGFEATWIGTVISLLLAIVGVWIGAESVTKTEHMRSETKKEEMKGK
jgi:membrane protein implicated in regulation of membrane protease activity